MYRLLFISTLFIISCREATLFSKVSSSHSGITFRNDIIENDSMNILELENIYNGGGVGIADFNNDGLPDIYFTGNMVENKLYLNKGDLSFQDITASAGVAGEDKWARGISIVDINNDGWQDMYISETIYNDPVQRENILYVNQGANKDGIPTFKNLAKEYGLNDDSHTSQSAFFDHDNDGDLDVYLAVNVFSKGENPNAYRRIFKNGEHPNTDRLYRNDYDSIKGHPYFTDVSREAGILQEGFAHSVTICDINLDGWKDVFVANDFLSENLLWINNRNGTFTNRSKEYFKHTSYNAMGADVVGVGAFGQREATMESAVDALLPGQLAAGLLTVDLPLALDGEDALVHAHLDRGRIHARHVDQDHEALVFLADVHPRRPLAGFHGGLVIVAGAEKAAHDLAEIVWRTELAVPHGLTAHVHFSASSDGFAA